MVKKCFKCGYMKDLSEFYKHPRMADGHLNKCKECTKKDVAENYSTHRDQYAEYERRRFQDQERKEMAAKYQKKRRRKDPEKDSARRRVSRAVKNGELKRKPCEVCGSFYSQAHHEDYSKPLDVIWLCRKHHLELHGKVAYA